MPEEIDAIKLEYTCSDFLLLMHHWMRGDSKKAFRCTLNFCEFHPCSERKGEGCPFFLVVYHEQGNQFFIQAVSPMNEINNRLALLKRMFCEENLPALMHTTSDVDAYWNVINRICASEFAAMSMQTLRIEVEIQKPPFALQETKSSLSSKAIGRSLKCAMIPRGKVTNKMWTERDWNDFIDGVFYNFRHEAISKETWEKMGPAQRRLAKAMDHLHPDKDGSTRARSRST